MSESDGRGWRLRRPLSKSGSLRRGATFDGSGKTTEVDARLAIPLRTIGIKQNRRPLVCLRYRSISPITMSSEPTIAGMSPSRKSLQMGAVTERLQKHELLARARSGFALAVADDVKAHLAAGAFGFEIDFVLGELGAIL